MNGNIGVLRVAIPVPLRRTFDYLPPLDRSFDTLRPGMRMLVPFGRQSRVGYLAEIASGSTVDSATLKPIIAVLDDHPLLTPRDLALLKWSASYYHHPLGEVLASAFPTLLRTPRRAAIEEEPRVRLTAAGWNCSVDALRRAPRQAALLQLLKSTAGMLPGERLRAAEPTWRQTIKQLIRKGFAEFYGEPSGCPAAQPSPPASPAPFPLNPAQREAVELIGASFGRYGTFLVDGVTGSGKTEVYLRLTEAALRRGEQVMVLLPEISLTPQLERRFLDRFAVTVAVFHSRLRDTERMAAWLRVQNGEAAILLGTRSAVFVPLKRPGLIVIDEEHDPSFKQQENFRFSARDVAIKKAQYLGIPILLGSATPSLETLWNVTRGRYRRVELPDRAGGAATPRFRVLDVRHQRLHEGLSPHLIAMIRSVLEQQEQVLLFLNRRGYAPTLICDDCGWVAPCSRCDARLVIHLRDARLRCHYCGHERRIPRACPDCSGSGLHPLGQGTERLEQTLGGLFPGFRVLRIDRDSTSRVGSLRTKLEQVHSGDVDILLGTQMLAKGHHFPRVTLVAIIDVDSLLFATDFRASERMAQLIVQVAGRAGRAERPGTVVLQTRHPDHPLLKTLIDQGYQGFAAAALNERRLARLPPYSYLAIWRAEAPEEQRPRQFLQRLRDHATSRRESKVCILGPAPAPMLRQAGRYRYHLLLSSPERKALHAVVERLERYILEMGLPGRLRWSVDIDPVDCY